MAAASRHEEALRRSHVRDANEQLEEAGAGLGSDDSRRVVFYCECGNCACSSLLSLTVAEYEAARAFPSRFLIAPNHENPEDERVVCESGRYAIVETVTAEPSRLAWERYPRWQRGGPW